jgi:hypothetical protein
VTNHASPSGSPTMNLGLVDARTLPVKGSLNAKWHNGILDDSVVPTLWQQFVEGPFLFQHDNVLCTKHGPYRNGLSTLAWKNLTGLHRALTLTPSNIFLVNWNADCEPGLMA